MNNTEFPNDAQSLQPELVVDADHKLPPQDLQVEQAVLGGLLFDETAWEVVADRVNADDFYRPAHRLLFKAIAQLNEQQIPVDVLTTSDLLKANGDLYKVGGVEYLDRLVERTLSAVNIAAYADLIREKAVLRDLSSAGYKIANSVFDPQGLTTSQLIEQAEQEVFIINNDYKQKKGSNFVHVKNSLFDTISLLEERCKNRDKGNALLGYDTGFYDLNKYIKGLRAKTYLLAGRPGMGKSSVAECINLSVAKSGDYIANFSAEMGFNEINERRLAILTGINSDVFLTGNIEEEHWEKIFVAHNFLFSTNVFDYAINGFGINTVISECRRLAIEAKKANKKLALITIDYLQLMIYHLKDELSSLADITRKLKLLALELDCPILIVSQLNRECEKRANKRPNPSDFRGSGTIEQDADVILFIYRDEFYTTESNDKGIAELIIAKNRGGKTGTVKLKTELECFRFQNLTKEYDDVDL
jgi:replicative DNA helicase